MDRIDVDPEVPDGLRTIRPALPGETASQRQRDPDADRGRQEVVPGEPGHLREVAHRALAAVVLPVGVGREAGGGVERQRRFHRSEVLRVPGKERLQPLDAVGHGHRDQAEEEHGGRVLPPGLLLLRVHPRDPVEEALHGAEDARQGLTLALEHAEHVKPHGLGDGEDRPGRRARSATSRWRSWATSRSARGG